MEACTGMASPRTIAAGIDKLSYEIFSLLESKFLLLGAGGKCLSEPETPTKEFLGGGRVRVLSIDGCGAAAEDALLAAAALARLESGLRKQAGDLFDVAAGAGAGGVLAAMLFLRGSDGRPRYSAEEALAFVTENVGRKVDWGGRRGRWAKLFRGARTGDQSLRRVFGDATLRDTEKVDALVAELVEEQERRRRSPLPNVAIKQVGTPSPRLSSATTASSVTTTRTASTMPSPLSCHSRR